MAYDDFHKIIATLKQAEKSADKKMAELYYAKTKIERARTFYENKLNGEPPKESLFIKPYPQRVILLSDSMQTPTLDNLWNYHMHFYDQLSDTQKSEFSFEDLAGIYEHNGKSRLFAICTKRRHYTIAARQLFMRRLHGRKPRASHSKTFGNRTTRICRQSAIYDTVDRAFRHITMELSSTNLDHLT